MRWRLVVIATVSLVAAGMGRRMRVAGGGMRWGGVRVVDGSRVPGPSSRSRFRVQGPTERRDLDIAFYAARAERDPEGAFDRMKLASLYLRRAREDGRFDDYVLAERTARASLALRTAHNTHAAVLLANALMAQHRFAEALNVTRDLDAREPNTPAIRAMLGEIELEVGLYDSARAIFASLPGRTSLELAPRFARALELTGHRDSAAHLMRRVLTEAVERRDLPPEQRAWFYWRVGDLALRAGKAADADAAFRAGLRLRPDDYRLLSGMARLAQAQHRSRDAIEYGERAIAQSLDPATLGVLSDAVAAVGDTTKAEEYVHVMEVAVLHQPGALHRAWSLFLLDHHRDVPQVMAKVREELRTRKDVYGYDLLAWALHASGRDAEAVPAMRRALAQHTEDAMLWAHAAAIEAAIGECGEARADSARARALSALYEVPPLSCRRAR